MRSIVWRGQVLDVEAVPVTGFQLVMQVGPPINDEVRVYFVPDDPHHGWKERVIAALETIAAAKEAGVADPEGDELQMVARRVPKRPGKRDA